MKRYLSSFTLPSKTDQEFALEKRSTAGLVTRMFTLLASLGVGGNPSGDGTITSSMAATGLENHLAQPMGTPWGWSGGVSITGRRFSRILWTSASGRGSARCRRAARCSPATTCSTTFWTCGASMRASTGSASPAAGIQGPSVPGLSAALPGRLWTLEKGHLRPAEHGLSLCAPGAGGRAAGQIQWGDRLAYFTSRVTEGRLYLLDERRTASLRITNRRWRGFLEDSAGFTAASWSLPPTLLPAGLKGAAVYDLDAQPPAAALAGTAGDADLGRVFPGPSGGVGGTIKEENHETR